MSKALCYVGTQGLLLQGRVTARHFGTIIHHKNSILIKVAIL